MATIFYGYLHIENKVWIHTLFMKNASDCCIKPYSSKMNPIVPSTIDS